jgi:hypothetical protein
VLGGCGKCRAFWGGNGAHKKDGAGDKRHQSDDPGAEDSGWRMKVPD